MNSACGQVVCVVSDPCEQCAEVPVCSREHGGCGLQYILVSEVRKVK